MYHKRHRARDSEAPPGKRLRDNLVDLYGSGAVTGERAQTLLEDAGALAQEAGTDDFQDLRAHTSAGSMKNIDRDLRVRLLKRSRWPPVYIEEVNCWSVSQKVVVKKKLAFLLPHELVGVFSEAGEKAALVSTAGLDSTNLKRHKQILEKLGTPFVSLSLWGDGVPFSWDRKRSVDTWTLSFPGLSEKSHRDIRVCLTAVPHEFMIGECQDDIMAVLAWSLTALSRGQFPEKRRDGSDWGPGETWRKRRAGLPLLQGILLEVKGDWKQLQACFGVPGWSSRPEQPICWRCTASKQSIKEEFGLQSSWLKEEERLEHFQCLQRIMDSGGSLSPIWQVPFLTTEALRLDWLHVADQGITPVFLGGLFHMVLCDKAVGRNEEVRLGWLWQEVQAFYKETGVVDRLHNLVKTMVKPKKGSIELSGSGAQIRALVPFGLQLVNAWEGDLTLEKLAAKSCMRELALCYSFLSTAEGMHSEGTLLEHALAFQRNLQGLHKMNAKRWQMRPKLHMFLELAAEGSNPAASWNYREESFGGSVSRQAHRKGGQSSPLAMSRSTLTKFCAKESVPKVMA